MFLVFCCFVMRLGIGSRRSNDDQVSYGGLSGMLSLPRFNMFGCVSIGVTVSGAYCCTGLLFLLVVS